MIQPNVEIPPQIKIFFKKISFSPNTSCITFIEYIRYIRHQGAARSINLKFKCVPELQVVSLNSYLHNHMFCTKCLEVNTKGGIF